jgi:hypothetical protein
VSKLQAQTISAQPEIRERNTEIPQNQTEIEPPKPIISLDSDKIVYRIKPFKDNENSTAYWQSFLKSFADVTDPVEYVITGNRASIAMYAIMPSSVALYFENVFYANFSTSELLKESFVPRKPQYRISY